MLALSSSQRFLVCACRAHICPGWCIQVGTQLNITASQLSFRCCQVAKDSPRKQHDFAKFTLLLLRGVF